MASSCLNLTSGFCASNCRNGAGGVAGVWFANKSEIAWNTLTTITDATSPNYKAITELENNGDWYYFESFNDTSSFTEEITATESSIAYKQSLTLVLGSLSQPLRNTLEELGESALVAIVEDRQGRKWFLGDPQGFRGLLLMSGNSTSGTQISDRNAAELTFEVTVPKPMVEVQPTTSSELESGLASATCNTESQS